MTTHWTADDRAELSRRGISLEEAERQLRVLTSPVQYARLDRPCTIGDGIERIHDARAEALIARARAAAHAGRVSKFVPASGAASRMFKDLLARNAEAVRAFTENAACFPFDADSIDAVLHRYANEPKGLIPFHRYADGSVRTPFEEHLVEAAALVADAQRTARVHFTVGDRAADAFRALAARRGPAHEARAGEHFEITYSTQSPSTDTIAAGADGAPFRDESGALLFRPAGHGALLENLHALGAGGADIVFVKNIDNVVPDHLRASTERWARIVIGRLIEAQDASRDARPVRVCGMVPNTGEPGGGPFWVAGGGAQIVETAQVDPHDGAQQSLLARSTHFNPVFLACGLRSARAGAPYDLHAFVDPAAVIVTNKSHGGRGLLALERPGLWNGAMARWETIFVEVPGEVFTPVKTVLDLLRVEHQPPDAFPDVSVGARRC
jgi:hypothetical protein